MDRIVTKGQPITRILSQVEVDEETGCWIFTGRRDRNGYGHVNVRIAGTKQQVAHRAMWVAVRGLLAKGLELHHKCEQRACVNIEHLQAVTRREHKAFTPKKTHCPRGHPLVEGNLVLYRLARGELLCLICTRARHRTPEARRRDRERKRRGRP